MRNRFEKMPIWFLALAVNFVVALVAIGPFLLRDNGYIAMSHDFSAQELGFNILMNETVKSGNLLWSWNIDIGSNFLESFSFYNVGSIFFLASLIFPAQMMPRVMGWMMIIKYAVAGATASVYINRYSKNRAIVIMTSMLYAFSGWQCVSVVFYHFQDAVALFPLMLIGLEELVEENKRGRLLSACVLNVFCNYIFFVGEVIFLVIYYVVKYLVPDIKARKKGFVTYATPIASCIAEGGIGMAISGLILVPAVYGTLSNTRVSSHILGADWFTMTTVDWLRLMKAFLVPAETMNRTSSVQSYDWMTNAAYLPVFGILFVLAYVMAKKDWMTNFFKVCLVIAAVPLFNSVFMTFMPEGYRRWFYMLILVMAAATAQVAEHTEAYPLKKAAKIWGILMGFYIFMTFCGIYTDGGHNVVFMPVRYWTGVAIAIVGIVVVYYLFAKQHEKRILIASVLVAVCSVVTLHGIIDYYQTSTDNSDLHFQKMENSYAENVVNYLTEIPGQLEKDVLPYRYYFDEALSNGIDSIDENGGYEIEHSFFNFAMASQLPSVNSFISTVHSSVVEFYELMGASRNVWTEEVLNGCLELLSAKHIVANAKHPEYTYVDEVTNSNGQTMYIYENEKALPIGFTYDTYMLRSEFEALEREVRPSAMLKTLVINNEDLDKVVAFLEHYDADKHGVIEKDTWITAVEERRLESSEEFVQGDNQFYSVITAEEEKFAFFSVPYDKSWKATVNGKPVNILNINGLMAVKIEAGRNEILFQYEYMPLKAGIACSCLGVVAAVVYMAVFRKKR